MRATLFKRYALFVVPLVAVIAVVVVVLGRTNHMRSAKVDQNGYTARLNASDMELQSSYKLADGGDRNGDGAISAGDTLAFTFTLTNKGTQSARQVKLDTGIPNKYATYVDSLTGATGLLTDESNVVFDNIFVQPNGTQTISFTTATLRSPDDYSIDFSPRLMNPDKSLALSGEAMQVAVIKADAASMRSQVKVEQSEGDR